MCFDPESGLVMNDFEKGEDSLRPLLRPDKQSLRPPLSFGDEIPSLVLIERETYDLGRNLS